ncbi:hypothetical protein EI42_01147 [Thermosporothrix hazakensis]|jgi:hypothetical protein|uniref:DUF5808 domain-containing protein n=1 Tax=Thermosporothrix hazakensis TaxID=644383 RepID=A0A326UB55_THEHA|nr:DUF5808 domain-containing protein [Thermosporothrix hazakensis]PZW34310.1 hypothetical protein EI42_01147 [Thermosporothrix hazakensis]GCE46138.1 hypothetical protein KTH_10070 [Thermosporothrix hazakensis]
MTRKQISTLLLAGLGTAAVGAAIFDQMRRPAEQRTWHGSLGPIPYDFRWPTSERLREKLWNKETSRVLMPHVFGVGWTLNFYPLLHPDRLS